MVDVIGISKSFGDNEVLKDVSLHIDDGEVVCLFGKSGAGKSTLLNIIGSLLFPTTGKVLINGENIYALPENKLSAFRNKNIGFIFQTPQLIEELNVLQNILLPYWISNKKNIEIEKRVETLLVEFGIEALKESKISHLSGGEKQRVSIIRAMVMMPKIIIADEPTGNLDEMNKKYLAESIIDMNKKYHQTILIATHDKDFAKITNNVVEIKDGKMYKI